jgi:hypothetical protein
MIGFGPDRLLILDDVAHVSICESLEETAVSLNGELGCIAVP